MLSIKAKKQLVELADTLDSKGLTKEATVIDNILQEINEIESKERKSSEDWQRLYDLNHKKESYQNRGTYPPLSLKNEDEIKTEREEEDQYD